MATIEEAAAKAHQPGDAALTAGLMTFEVTRFREARGRLRASLHA